MELVETHGMGIKRTWKKLPSQELLKKRPNDPRAWHCKTVEEYRLWKYSSDYSEYKTYEAMPIEIYDIELYEGLDLFSKSAGLE